ncbi:MAG: hypothetical protein ACHQF2_07235 [Flavobacteriales bacterium]
MKVKGFTTLELAVAMVLAALVTGIGYSGYTLFSKQFHGYRKNLDETGDFRNFQTLLYKDFYLSRSVERGEDALQMKYDNGKEIKYEWSTQYVLRKQDELVDTFRFPVYSVKTEFQRHEQFIPGGKVDFIEIELEYKKQRLALMYHKEYSRAELMEWEHTNEH